MILPMPGDVPVVGRLPAPGPGAKPPPIEAPPIVEPLPTSTYPRVPPLLYFLPPVISPGPDAGCGGITINQRSIFLSDLTWQPGARFGGVEFDQWWLIDERARPPEPPAIFPWTCPDCQVGHWDSAVVVRNKYTSTMMVTTFYDIADAYHVHDPNITTTWFVCSRNHQWGIQETNTCPNPGCIWPHVV